MLPSANSELLTTMAAGTKVVSKRSARTYTEDEMETDAAEYQSKRTSRHYEEATSDDANRKGSISTSTTSLSTQSSRHASQEASPLIAVAGREHGGSKHPAEGLGHHGGGVGFSEVLEAARDLDDFDTNFGQSSLSLDEFLPTMGRPINFGVVVPGVYRSSFPQTEDHGFIEALKLKTIVTLVQKDFPEGYVPFISKNGIRHHVFDMQGTKKKEIPIQTMKAILRLVLDTQNHPLLIHCNHGKHRTGCVVGVVRKLTGWELSNIIREYKNYAEPKVRECDINYITGFEPASITNLWVKEASMRLQTRSFVRATVFAMFVLFIWIFSGNRITMTSSPKQQRKLAK
ncbi:tyrosine phosphatase family-domain-containing protein [Apodospora peruviana]|uniref:diphosphoinositol-polyphosphate diphosphatase n=1 Tax=Apodospora peruviana TaxID=516989 RepID=A0AAE0HX59_9PEZI|nr:tyrosine phosphatase family-domain-containing protein [Apodospora peruviana]